MEYFTNVSIERWVLLVWAILCGGYDCWRRRLPNVLTLGGSAAALAMLMTTGHGWIDESWASCLGAACLALVLTLPAYCIHILGAGDVKMLFSLGLFGGMDALLISYGVAGFAVGVVTIIWLWLYRWEAWLANPLRDIGIERFSIPNPKHNRLPFGFALAIGFSVALVGQPVHLFKS